MYELDDPSNATLHKPISFLSSTKPYHKLVTPAPLNNCVKEVLGKMRPTWDFTDFDCCFEYIVMANRDWKVAVNDQDK